MHTKHVVIVGGGIAGLAAAWSVRNEAGAMGVPVRCTLIEAESRWGGKIWTRAVGDFLVEAGPDSFLSQKPAALDLCRELGLESEIVDTKASPDKAFVYSRGRLRPLPEGLVVVAPRQVRPFLRSGVVSWWGAARMALDVVLPAERGHEDESVASFFRRRLGSEAFDRFIEPLMAGIYAGDAEQMSLAATFPRFVELERRHGSVIRGMAKAARARGMSGGETQRTRTMFVTLRGGLGRLVQTLIERLTSSGVHTRQGRRVVALAKGTGSLKQEYQLRLDDGMELTADAVILATPAYVTADLLSRVDRELASLLGGIPYASTVTVSLAYDEAVMPSSVRGYGFVVPRVERRDLLAATWTSLKWPNRAPAGRLVARCYVGGVGREAIVKADDETIVHRVRDELSALAGVTQEPQWSLVTRWDRAMPQYHVGHLHRLDRISGRLRGHRGLHLTGAAYRGIGIPDCIHDGLEVGRRVVQECEGTWP